MEKKFTDFEDGFNLGVNDRQKNLDPAYVREGDRLIAWEYDFRRRVYTHEVPFAEGYLNGYLGQEA